jgi:hypothetical protein
MDGPTKNSNCNPPDRHTHGSGCGLHAYFALDEPQGYWFYNDIVCGLVEAHGKIIVYTKGMRSQFQTLLGLFKISSVPGIDEYIANQASIQVFWGFNEEVDMDFLVSTYGLPIITYEYALSMIDKHNRRHHDRRCNTSPDTRRWPIV